MTTAATKGGASSPLGLNFASSWPLWLGFAVLAAPTVMTLSDQTWSRESGAHGPIILAAGGWLLWRLLPEFKRDARPGSLAITIGLLVVGLVVYALGRAYDFITLEAAGVYSVGLAMIHDKLGLKLMLRNWFPFLYLAFTIPPPTYLMDQLTAPLKLFVSYVATSGLQATGLPIAREGVTIMIAQYQLLVEDACSGMNSLVGLTAISLMYIYLMHGSSWRYSALLICFVIPIAIIANIIRIVTLVLITYFLGDQAAQGFLLFAAGIVLFATALLLVFAVDKLLAFARPSVSQPA